MLLSEVVTLKIKGMSRPQPLFIVLLLALTLLPKKPLPSLAQLLVQGEPHPELLMQLTLLVDIQLDLELRLRLDDLHHMDFIIWISQKLDPLE